MAYETLLYEVEAGVARITLNRPDAANTLNGRMSLELMQAAVEADEDQKVRAVLLSGNGPLFCAGGDLREFHSAGDTLPRHIKTMIVYLHAAISRLTRMDAPVIAAVHGVAAGAGMSLACMSDIVIAEESARFTMAYTRAGLTPDGSSTYFLPRLVGLKRALELTLSNRVLAAQEAVEWGIATRVVPDGQALERAQSLAEELATGPTLALGRAKRLLHAGLTETLETQMEFEAQGISETARSGDAKEGISAFLEKRPPRFKGE